MPYDRKPHDPIEVFIAEICKHPGAKQAFERLCQEGASRQQLALNLATMKPPGRDRKLLMHPADSRRLAAKVRDLLNEMKTLDVVWWRRTTRRVSAEPVPPVITDLLGEMPSQAKSPFVKLDFGLLREQLQAACRYFDRVAKLKAPLAYGFYSNASAIDYLLSTVREQTGKPHYKELSILCDAAMDYRNVSSKQSDPDALKAFDPDALKTRDARMRRK